MDGINWNIMAALFTAIFGAIFGYRFNKAYANEKLELARKIRSEKNTEDVKRLMLIMDVYKDDLVHLRKEFDLQKSSAIILVNALENKNRKLESEIKNLRDRIKVLEDENANLLFKIENV